MATLKSKEDFNKLKAVIEYNIEDVWGPRCKTKDTDDFPEIFPVGSPDDGRCPTCLVYEKFDKFWECFSDVSVNVEVS